MTGSTKKASRIPKVIRASAIALLVVGAGCTNTSTPSATNPTISADVDRGESGALQALTVKGSKFTPNGEVLVTVLLVGDGPNANQYLEETLLADANGRILYERQPLPCPTATGYGAGRWTWVNARDASSGISGDQPINPGSAADCTSG
ncbi:MAG: hypothetical protein ACR2HM_10710 [Acidimicrobiales bacterium]